jgi:phosphoribosylamine--glycine ligase
MRVLMVGGGGREHALVWKIAQSPLVESLWCAPGNAGTAAHAQSADLASDDIDGLAEFARRNGIDLTVVGPEAPLVGGIREAFDSLGLKLFGPSSKAAALEGSKVFAKEFMARHGIPTAPFRVFDDPREARDWIRRQGGNLVVKADGLAAGKGVIVCSSTAEASAAVDRIMTERAFGTAGDRVVVEERLEGPEVSLLALISGNVVVPLLPARDFKRAQDGDLGLNTGGMGSIAPHDGVDAAWVAEIERTVFGPVCRGLAEEGAPYQGILYAGLMLTDRGPQVLEFNCRFGDPETQAILPLLRSDLAELLAAVVDGDLAGRRVEFLDAACVCVVLASGGYPGPIEGDKEIRGLDSAMEEEGVVVFHAATAATDDGRVWTRGGRVLSVSAVAPDFARAGRRAYEAAERIRFDGMQFRRDIGPAGGGPFHSAGSRPARRSAGGT